MLDKVEYLDHVISAKGLQPSKTKTEAVSAVPPSQNVSQLRSFLGIVKITTENS